MNFIERLERLRLDNASTLGFDELAFAQETEALLVQADVEHLFADSLAMLRNRSMCRVMYRWGHQISPRKTSGLEVQTGMSVADAFIKIGIARRIPRTL